MDVVWKEKNWGAIIFLTDPYYIVLPVVLVRVFCLLYPYIKRFIKVQGHQHLHYMVCHQGLCFMVFISPQNQWQQSFLYYEIDLSLSYLYRTPNIADNFHQISPNRVMGVKLILVSSYIRVFTLLSLYFVGA